MRNWLLVLLIALSGVLGAAALRATAQSVMTGPRTGPAAAPREAAPNAPAPSAAPAAPRGVIRDDPTVAPDKAESADNNVSFPVDI